MTSTQRRHGFAIAAFFTMAMALAACGSSSSKGSGTTLGSGASNAKSTTTSASTSGTTGGSSGTTASQTSAKLVTPLCDILDSSTINRVMATNVGSCQNFANEGTAGRCLWGNLGPGKSNVQLTAFTGADFAQKKVGWQVAFPKVSGAGNGAWSRGPLSLGAAGTNVVLYVDYGDFGMEFALGAPTATTDQAVQLANAIK